MKNFHTPFKFLDSFTLADRAVFFGRDKEVEQVYKMVFKTPLLLVYGLSGTGKTSLIQCGLASRFDGPDWLPLWVRRQSNINESLQTAIHNATPLALQTSVRDNAVGEMDAWAISEQIKQLYQHYLRPVFLIFDQFEELFILGKEPEQAAFVEQLKGILQNELPCTVLLVIREEYLGQLYHFEKEIPSLFDFRLRIEPMDNANVKTVLSESFRRFKITVEEPKESRYDEIIQNVSRGKSGIELPYLQVYLDRLYRENFERTYPNQIPTDNWLPLEFTQKEIAEFGTIDNVLDKFLEEQQTDIQAYLKNDKDPEVSDNAVRAVLNAFVSDEGTKRPVRFTRSDNIITLGEAEQGYFPKLKPTTLTACLLALENARLIREDETSIELAHDSLALLIDRKRTADERRRNDIKRQITLAYQTNPTTQEYLTRKQITAFEDIVPDLDLDKEVLAFFRSSDAFRTEEAAALLKKERKRLTILGTIAAVAIIGLGVATWAFFTARESEKQATAARKEAVTAADQAKIAEKEAEEQKDIAVKKTQETEVAKVEALRLKGIADNKSREATNNLTKMQEAQAAKNKIEISKYLNSAQRMVELGKYGIARKILNQALQIDKTNTDILKKLKEIEGK